MSKFAVVYAHPDSEARFAYPSKDRSGEVVRVSPWPVHWVISKSRAAAERRLAKYAATAPLMAQFLEVREVAA